MDARITDLVEEKGSEARGSEGARRATGEPPAPATVAADPEVAAGFVGKQSEMATSFGGTVGGGPTTHSAWAA